MCGGEGVASRLPSCLPVSVELPARECLAQTHAQPTLPPSHPQPTLPQTHPGPCAATKTGLVTLVSAHWFLVRTAAAGGAGQRRLVVANAGDCRAVVASAGWGGKTVTTQLSVDQTPDRCLRACLPAPPSLCCSFWRALLRCARGI